MGGSQKAWPASLLFAATARFRYVCAANHPVRGCAGFSICPRTCKACSPPHGRLRPGANSDSTRRWRMGMLPNLRFTVGAMLATALLVVTAFGIAATLRLAREAKTGPLETSRSLAYTDQTDWNQFRSDGGAAVRRSHAPGRKRRRAAGDRARRKPAAGGRR